MNEGKREEGGGGGVIITIPIQKYRRHELMSIRRVRPTIAASPDS